jgi:hypothetical protein
MSNSNALPLLDLGLQISIALLESSDMLKFPLPRVTSSKSVASSLESDFIGRIDADRGKRTLSATRLSDIGVQSRRACD